MRALLSVWDKRNIVEFAERLHHAGVEIISTGGTFRAIEQSGVPVRSVSDVTGFPEMIDGRVKTLHPNIHGGILARRDVAEHMHEIQQQGIAPIDIVVGNLYPFGEVVSRPGASLDDALEHIDIGGPSMIRAAAKNYPSVLVVVDPDDYDFVARIIERRETGEETVALRRHLAAKAFAHVAAYDAVIAEYLRSAETFPERISISGEKVSDLRYGENPHQRAAIYRQMTPSPPFGVGNWRLMGGKEMSFNNYLDANAARQAALEFSPPAVAIIKHTVPCGLAVANELSAAYEQALASDPVSAFGGVVAMNRVVDLATADHVADRYYEVIVAPGYDEDALARLRRKKNLRIIESPDAAIAAATEIRALDGAFLLQQVDRIRPNRAEWRAVTALAPSDDDLASMEFAWLSVRHVKSNAIVLVQGQATVGIGGGQPNRVDAVRIAAERAGPRARGSILASDAFFPFADNVEVAAAAGVRAIIQPGGSVRDDEVIAAANAAGIIMVFTGVRHFRH